jgi:hypothetical protein
MQPRMQYRTFKAMALALALSAAASGAVAQDYVFGWNPRTGDAWVDTRLDDINRYGDRYREPFVDEMARYYGAPRDLVSDLLVNRRWAPGDVYYACAIAQAIGRACRYVVDEWNREHAQGWGVLAQRLGIAPGTAEFHRLKRGFVPTYDRWDRPIVLDDDLRRAFPDRGKRTAGATGRGPKEAAAAGRPRGEGQAAKSGEKGPRGGAPSAKPRGKQADGGNGKPGGKGNGQDGKGEGGATGKGKG